MEISFTDIKTKLSINKILAHVNEEDIYKRFAKDFPKSSCRSPFRKDLNPSFGYFVKSGKWQWKDAIGDGGDVFDYIMKSENTDLQGALSIIVQSFNIDLDADTIKRYKNNTGVKKVEKYDKERSLIQAVRKPFTKADLQWWHSNGIGPELLEFFKIRCACEVWLKKPAWNEKKLLWTFKENDPIYYWTSPFSNNMKAYRPLHSEKKYKFISNMDDSTDVQGYLQANIKRSQQQPLLIVKSMKEIAFFKSFGYRAVAPNAEGYIINPDFIRHLKKYCFPIIAIYDADLAGVKGMQRLKRDYKISSIVIPKYAPVRIAKDPTDLWKRDYQKIYHLLNIINERIESIRQLRMVESPF